MTSTERTKLIYWVAVFSIALAGLLTVASPVLAAVCENSVIQLRPGIDIGVASSNYVGHHSYSAASGKGDHSEPTPDPCEASDEAVHVHGSYTQGLLSLPLEDIGLYALSYSVSSPESNASGIILSPLVKPPRFPA